MTDFVATADVPIIAIRPIGYEEFHPDVYTYISRARLDAAHGHHDNHVIFTESEPLAQGPAEWIAFDWLDAWLSAIEEDQRDLPTAEKVVANRPPGLVDACYTGGQVVATGEACEDLFPPFSQPRLVAGAPLTDHVLKCRLRPLDRNDDYGPLPFTDAQWARLESAFPTGVCDWTQPGEGVQPTVTWLDYSAGTGGVPLGPAPVSVPFGPGSDTSRPPTLPTTGGGMLFASLLMLVAGSARRRSSSWRRRFPAGRDRGNLCA